MAITTASRLAPYLLFKAKERGIEITNLKLQKLLYYCQVWHLSITGHELFNDRIEAWVHGPVVPPVFGNYKEYRWRSIPPPETEPTVEDGLSDRPILEHVSEVLDVYGLLTGTQLEMLTHREKPWIDARAGIPADAPSTAIISHESMREYYKAA